MAQKSVIKIIGRDNYEKECVFLQQMSLYGMHFARRKGYVFYFEKGAPIPYIYRIEKKQFPQDAEYFRLHVENGWTFITRRIEDNCFYYYFKKEDDTTKVKDSASVYASTLQYRNASSGGALIALGLGTSAVSLTWYLAKKIYGKKKK